MHRGAALRPATMSRPRPVVLVVGIADRKRVVESMINSKQPSSDVDLVIVVRVPAKTVLSQRVAVERRDVGNRKGSQRTTQRVVSRDDVSLTGNWETRGGVESIAIANGDIVDQPGCGRIKDFTLVDRSAQRIVTYDTRRVQKPSPAEVTLPLGHSRKSVDEAGVDRAVIIETVHVDEPKRLAPPGNLGNWPAHGSPPVILSQGEALAQEEIRRVQFVGGQEIVYVAVQPISAGFRGVGNKTTTGVSILC